MGNTNLLKHSLSKASMLVAAALLMTLTACHSEKKIVYFQDVKDNSHIQMQALQVVSEDENAVWLIDYWCGKDIRGLIGMPFSRHWIMHTEAALRIRNQLQKKRKVSLRDD